MSGKSFDRAVRESHIEMVFVNRYKLKEVSELTAAQVARELMLEPSGHIRSLLAGMVAKGVLEVREQSDARLSNLKGNHAYKYWFKLSDSLVRELENSAREIPVKIGGKAAGQLRLF